MAGDGTALLEATPVGKVIVVRFTRRTILDAEVIEAIGDRLAVLVGEEAHRHLVLDFERVESLTSGLLGKFVTLQRQVEALDGRLAFCGVGPFLRTIFALCKMPPTIPVYATADEAVKALS